MKKPKLNFKTVYVVEDWTTEIKVGVGVFFPELKEYLVSYTNYWLVWFDDNIVPEKIYKDKVFTDMLKAQMQLDKTKKDYIRYLEKSIKENTNTLNEVKNG